MAAQITIGVLALQGDFAEHIATFKHCEGVKTREIRKTEELSGLDALVIPGGESTVMVKLLVEFNMFDDLVAFGRSGTPMFGTCAGCIMMSRSIDGMPEQKTLDLADYSVARNAYGSQVHSFESDLGADKEVRPAPAPSGAGPRGGTPGKAESWRPDPKVFGEQPLRAVLIRAPMITRVGAEGKVLAQHDSHPVLWQQGSILTCTFHPEITGDPRVHQYFASFVRKCAKGPYAPK